KAEQSVMRSRSPPLVFWFFVGGEAGVRLDERRGAAMGGAVGFRIPALLGRDREACLGGRRGDVVIGSGSRHDRRVGHGTERAVVTLEPVVVLVARDQEERAREVQQ